MKIAKPKHRDMTRGTWQFLYRFWDEAEQGGDRPPMKERVYRNCSLRVACHRMAKFIDSRRWQGGNDRHPDVDYEAANLDVKYDGRRHDDHFYDLNEVRDNPLKEFI